MSTARDHQRLMAQQQAAARERDEHRRRTMEASEAAAADARIAVHAGERAAEASEAGAAHQRRQTELLQQQQQIDHQFRLDTDVTYRRWCEKQADKAAAAARVKAAADTRAWDAAAPARAAQEKRNVAAREAQAERNAVAAVEAAANNVRNASTFHGNENAKLSLILGLANVVSVGMTGFPGIFFGIKALKQFDAGNGGNRMMAAGGIASSVAGVIFGICMLIGSIN